ncbi:TetR/AcrR family transcriptional regulator [Microbacterium sp. gxy059]|uniref:Wt8.9 n=1 Tax=uncultured bacterium WT8 TaxID=1393214 RepID=U3PZ38_9BACT|nr:Wt8.9 [uncultured bacterium WT8]
MIDGMGRTATFGGRPRRSGVVTDDPRADILAVAADLFAAEGFSATSMTGIARAAGLRQSSLYYWFRSKDDILRAIMDQNRVSLAAARRLAGGTGPAAVRLYIVLYRDVVQMCSAPLNFYDLEEAAKQQPAVFSGFQEDYEELFNGLTSIVEDGVASGELRNDVPVAEFVRAALSLNEGSQHRFHVSGPHRSDIHEYAAAAASLSVRAALADADALASVREEAKAGIGGVRAVVDTADAGIARE